MKADFLEIPEFKIVADGLAEVAHVLTTSSTELECADLIDNALAHSKNMVAAGKWTAEISRDYLSAVTNAAAAQYALRRSVSEYEIRTILIKILYSLSGEINKRIGFSILPTSA